MYAIIYDGRVLHDPRFDGDAVASGKCSLAVSSAGSLEIKVTPGNPLCDALAVMSAEHEMVLLDDNEEVFRGRITEIGTAINGMRSVTAEGHLAYLNDSVVAPYGTYESTPDDEGEREWDVVVPKNRRDYAEWLISQHNAQTDPSKHYRIGINDLPDTPITRSSTQWPTTKTEIADKLIDEFGCVVSAYMLDGVRCIDFRADGGKDAAQTIEFGRNLLDFARTTRAVDAITCIVPVGKDADGREFGINDMPDGPVGEGMTKQGDRILSEDGISACGVISVKRSYDVSTAKGLIKACCSDLAASQLSIDSVEISAADMHLIDPAIERIRLGEWVFVSARPLKFEASMMCVSVEIDIADPTATKYVLGAELPTLANGGKSTASRMRKQESAMIERVRPISAEAKAAAKLAEAAVVASWDEYALADSSSDPPALGWSVDTPTWTDGGYIWRRAVTAYGDGTTVEGASACMTGNTGAAGEDGKQGIQGPPGEDGTSSYTHLAYANSADGTVDFSVSDSNRAYIGMYVDSTPADSERPSDYSWSLIKGADGSDGTPGKPGADGRTPYLHIAYATSADGSAGFSTTVSAGKTYIGQYTDYVQADSTTPSKYAWTLIKGDTGPKGDDGERGIQGPPGSDGKTYYTWLKYADTPTSGMSDSPTSKAYMGLAYNKTTATESTVYGDYQWSLVKGAKGDDGIPGGKGADGKTLYTWVKYATSTAGAGMSDSPVGKTYIGLAYNKTTATESASPSDYSWSLIKGDKGDTGSKGDPGKGISSTSVTYQASANGTTAPTGTWTTTIPSVAANQYLWTRITVAYTEGVSSTAYSVGKMGANGTDGKDGATGATGKGVKSTAVTYQAGASGTAAPTGTWVAAVPSVAANQYLWTRIVITYTDDAISTAYSVGKMGAQGPKGETGNPGKDGAPGAAGKPGADGADGKMLYGASNTAAGTTGKATASNIAGFSLYVGATVSIKFTYANTASAPTLNVNATGAKPILTNGVNAAYWEAGATVIFIWNGTYWCCGSSPVYATSATIGNPGGGNAYIDGNGMDVRQGSTVLARIRSAAIELGINAASAIIRMCGGKATVRYEAGTGYTIYESAGPVAVLANSGSCMIGVGSTATAASDRGIGMLGTKAVIRGSTVEINGYQLADYVIEQGTSGIWSYQKWASGIFYASGAQWLRTTTTGENNGYIATPFAVTSLQYSPVAAKDNGWVISGIYVMSNTQTSLRLVWWGSTGNTYDFSVGIYLVGRWK